LLVYAVIISLIGFMEAISVARVAAAQTGQRVDPNQELVGQGLANIVGAFTNSYPVSGSFSRTAVNLKAGAYTGLSSVVTSLVVVVTLLFFTPMLYYLPQSVLAAIIMMAVLGLININGFFHAWRAQWYDGVISIITFISTLFFAPHLDRGILVGVGLSLGVFLYKSMRPTCVDLSLGVDRALHDAVSNGLEQCRFIGVVRFDGPLFFANANYMEEQILERRKSKKQLKHIIMVANGINDIEASGQEALSFVVDRIRKAGIDISMSGANEIVMAALKRTHLMAKIGEDHFYPNMKDAVNAIHAQAHLGGDEENCPLKAVVVTSEGRRKKEN
jgi:MFS superfamily sulfate permease-like transporter